MGFLYFIDLQLLADAVLDLRENVLDGVQIRTVRRPVWDERRLVLRRPGGDLDLVVDRGAVEHETNLARTCPLLQISHPWPDALLEELDELSLGDTLLLAFAWGHVPPDEALLAQHRVRVDLGHVSLVALE